MSLLLKLKSLGISSEELLQCLAFSEKYKNEYISMNEAQLFRQNQNILLANLHLAKGKLSKIKPGPGLANHAAQEELISLIKVDCLQDHGLGIAQEWMLSSLPLHGGYKLKDHFIMRPLPADHPIGSGRDWFASQINLSMRETPQGPPYPFSLAFNYSISPNEGVNLLRVGKSREIYSSLLILIVPCISKVLESGGERIWVVVKGDDGPESHLLRRGLASGAPTYFEEDSEVIPATPIFSGDNYYDRLWFQDSQVILPKSLERDVGSYFALEKEWQIRFLRACQWFSLLVREPYSPLSSLFSAAAIESLFDGKFSRWISEEDVQAQSDDSKDARSLSSLVKNFYAVFSDSPKALRSIEKEVYAKRSLIVHGNAHPTHAEGVAFFKDPLMDGLGRILITRRSLINWLRDPCFCPDELKNRSEIVSRQSVR